MVSSYVRSAKSIDLGGTGFFRLVGLLAGACANFAVIAILSRDYGVEYYAFYALMASMLNLLPFADFGIGATMVNATADYRVVHSIGCRSNPIFGGRVWSPFWYPSLSQASRSCSIRWGCGCQF